ncbi:transcriptional corepressor LEUNIG_HOMOLOG-like [Daucus carota subsp. sativus]|uniref:transcriptional corepressor LEUNIG_HOMOLOG-like n=1 Tax=Daucus carota subsp. sativus TaxID=79200 RepID=UPI0030833306
MAQRDWDADKMLDAYIYDYLMAKKLHASAKAFKAERAVPNDPVAIGAPGGFLFEWWSLFWDSYTAKSNEAAALQVETQQSRARENQQQLQLIQQQNAQLQRWDPSHSSHGVPVNAMNSEGIMGQPSANFLDMKMYKDWINQGQLLEGNSGNMSRSSQQLRAQMTNVSDIKTEGNSGNQKSLPSHASTIHRQAISQSQPGLGSAGLNQGVSGLPQKGWALGIDQLKPNSGLQVHQPDLLDQNRFPLSSSIQQALEQAQAQGCIGSSPNYGFGGLPRGGLKVKDAELEKNKGSMCSQKMKMTQMPQSSSQHEQLQQNNNRERKQQSSSGPTNSKGKGNTMDPSPKSPVSTHTPGDEKNTASSLQHVSSGQKGLMMYGSETEGLASPENQLDDIEHIGDEGDVDSFLSNDGEDGRTLYDNIKQNLTGHKTESSKGFFLEEVGCIRTRDKVTCCHFSSDGKLLASAGHEKKAVLWNMNNLQTESTPEEHQDVITDVRFRPNSSQLVTASLDKSVKLWDAANPSYCLHAYTGHPSHVMSLDFHPKKNDMFCFCDSNNEIRYWNINPFSCTRVSKQGGSSQVRFEPANGRLLAAASDEGHSGVVNSLCWDLNGDYLASVCKESVKVWSLTSGKCVHELSSKSNQFHSCAFHPSYSALLMIGGEKGLELWNIAENKIMTVRAHENMIAALAQSPVTGMIASGSHDSSVKLWK